MPQKTKPWVGPALLHFRRTCELKESVVLILDLYVSTPDRDLVQYCNSLLLSLVVRRDGNALCSQSLIRGLL